MTDTRDTGEHFFGSLVGDGDGTDAIDAAGARRVADLTTQIDFLDREIARYRELIEKERIRHSTQLAEQQLETDARVDELRREERHNTQALHDSYRKLLNERQLDYESDLSSSVGAHAAELEAERARYEDMLRHERTRREVHNEASHKQAIDELNESHRRTRQQLLNELEQTRATVERLESERDEFVERARSAEVEAHTLDVKLTNVQRRLETIEQHHHSHIADLETQAATALKRLESERRRSASTLAELLERSASIAAEADKARSDFAAEQAKAQHAALSAKQRAEADYSALAEAADERASRALTREADLEAVIAELRNHISNKHR